MTSAPTVAVVVPTHDGVELLAGTLRSILAQRGVDVAVVVLDDGSNVAVAAAIG